MLTINADLSCAPLYPTGLPHPSALLKQMEVIAGTDLEQRGLPYEVLRSRGMVFVLTSTELELTGRYRPKEPVSLHTRAVGVRGPYFYRDFFLSQGGREFGNAVTRWVLMDFNTRHILRPAQLPELQPDPPAARAAARFEKLKSLELQKLGDRQVRYSDLDINRHLNNIIYFDIAVDFAPVPLEDSQVTGVMINYRKECLLGDVLELWGCPLQDGFYVEGRQGETRCFDVQVRLAPL